MSEQQEWQNRIVGEDVVDAATLVPNPLNWRGHPEHQRMALQGVLDTVGWVQRVIVNKRTGNTVDGHLRRDMAANKGEKIPVIYIDVSEDEERLILATLDPIAELATRDADMLKGLLDGIDTENEGLAALVADLDGVVQKQIAAEAKADGGLTDPDAIPTPPKDPKTQPGDLIVLGGHRLLCGDARLGDDVGRLVEEQNPECMWTDPPYGVSYSGRTAEAMTMAGDNEKGLRSLLDGAFDRADAVLAAGAPIYIAHAAGRLSVVFGHAFIAAGWRLHQTLVWYKDSIVLGHSDYHYRHEPILFGYKAGDGRCGRGGQHWYGDNAQASVLEVPRPKASREHPTSKPVELVSLCLVNSTKQGDTVYDPFAGSGSTMMACEQFGRNCMAIEIDPAYCDVIVQRWQEYTGNKADGWRGND